MKLEHLKTFTAHGAPLYALCEGPDNSIYTAGADRVVLNWNLETLEANPFSLRTDGSIFSLNYHTHKKLLFIGGSTKHFHWVDLDKRAEIKNYHVHNKGVFGVVFYGVNKMVSWGGEGSIAIWDLDSLSLLRQIPMSDSKIRSVVPYEENLAVTCGDGTVHILEQESLNEKHTAEAHKRSANTFLYHNQCLITGGWDGHLRLWDESLNLIKEIPAHNYAIYGLVSISDQTFASVSKDKTIKLWTSALEPIERYDFRKKGHNRSVNRCVQAHGKLATVGDDGKVIIWKITDH